MSKLWDMEGFQNELNDLLFSKLNDQISSVLK